jgi:hypothetical protein
MNGGDFFKYGLTRIGAGLPARVLYQLTATLNYLETGRWMRINGMETGPRFDRREQLFDLVARDVADRDVLYMEFGVFEGAATRHWSKLLKNPASKLHGFDSFEGLPEDWIEARPKGHFSQDGKIPVIDDPRVEFIKGWFDQTLPLYKPPQHQVLVLNLDADLYSSTIYVLNTLERIIAPGSYIYFDEFQHYGHELKAFDEFMKRTGMKFRVAGAVHTLAHVVFQRVS